MDVESYECEMAKCHDQLQKAEAELEKAQKSNVKWYRIVERREKQIVESESKRAKAFELLAKRERQIAAKNKEVAGLRKAVKRLFKHSDNLRIAKDGNEFESVFQEVEHAEQQLREMINEKEQKP